MYRELGYGRKRGGGGGSIHFFNGRPLLWQSDSKLKSENENKRYGVHSCISGSAQCTKMHDSNRPCCSRRESYGAEPPPRAAQTVKTRVAQPCLPPPPYCSLTIHMSTRYVDGTTGRTRDRGTGLAFSWDSPVSTERSCIHGTVL